jgi:hypothetical protein
MIVLIWLGCGGSPIYAPCEASADCPAPDGIDAECLRGEGDEGFCTWSCEADEDCAFDEDSYARVCSSFASEPGKHCFPSCEGAADDDPDACPPGYTCQSSGGGSDNRKICYPTSEAP